MVLPFFGFVFGIAFFGLLGVVALRVGSFAPVQPLTVATFIIAAFVGTFLYSITYRYLFAASGELQSRAAVLFFLIGVPVVATVSGVVVVKLVFRSGRSASST